MYGFKSMLIHLNPKQNILKILDKNSSSTIFLAKIISSKHIYATFCYNYLGAEARAMVYNYYLIRNQHRRIDTRATFCSKQSVFKGFFFSILSIYTLNIKNTITRYISN